MKIKLGPVTIETLKTRTSFSVKLIVGKRPTLDSPNSRNR